MQCWNLTISTIEKCIDFKAIAIFSNSNLQEPLLQQGNNNSLWHEVGKHGLPYQLENKLWILSLPLSKNSILHLEKANSFFSYEIDFLRVLCNIVLLSGKKDDRKIEIEHESARETAPPISRNSLLFGYPEIIGESPKLISILSTIDKISNTEISVLIQGESGTGKELIARAIHEYSSRKQKPFVSENCAAIPETLLESELFGYTRGAFTGAYQDKKGLFEIADKGTLFLDEVGDMSLSMQKKLLRALQSGEIRQVGGKETKKVDVRILAATNKNLKDAMQKGLFREDLFYRLNVVNLVLPPLRERKQDIPGLFQYFLQKNAQAMGVNVPNYSKEVEDILHDYAWPGNIREMQNEVKRILALLEGDTILPCSLSFYKPRQ
ncbi:MAG: sigma-54-dependent Fis family transcriptional regulator [Candidatus Brocadiae bacterium]|nr:sigma-54-dependent Fis family transcriptional regulator [Candidatus Brocadiia bacterium]